MPRLADLQRECPDLQLVGDPATLVTSVTSDSRAVAPGALFVAVPGRWRDGHAYVPEAVARGAAAVLAQDDVAAEVPRLVAACAREAHARVAAAFHGHPSRRLRVVGITGTDGKTTTGHLLDHVLTRSGVRTGRIGSLGAWVAGTPVHGGGGLTTPQPDEVQGLLAAMVAAGVDVAVVEASSAGLAEHRLDAVDFAAAVVTNVTAEHLEEHGGLEPYRTAKALLLKRAGAAGGVVVANLDDPVAVRLAVEAAPRRLTFGVRNGSADVRAVGVHTVDGVSRFRVVRGADSAAVSLPLPAAYNVENALAAITAALALGVDLAAAAVALRTAPAVPGRLVVVDEDQPFAVYVDYAHTVAAVGAVLAHLRARHPGGRVIAVVGTGLRRDHWKRPLLAQAAVAQADLTVITGSDAQYERPEDVVEHYLRGARAAGAEEGRDVVGVLDREEAIAHAVGCARPGDVVAVLGKGHESTIRHGTATLPWSDEDVVRTALRARREGRRG